MSWHFSFHLTANSQFAAVSGSDAHKHTHTHTQTDTTSTTLPLEPQASAILHEHGMLQFCSRQILQHRVCTTGASAVCLSQLLRVLQYLTAWAGEEVCEGLNAQRLGNESCPGGCLGTQVLQVCISAKYC
jgi:hypothetical protein